MLDTVLKHAKFFTKADHERETARVVHYLEDGSLFSTDSFKAVWLKDAHSEAAHTRDVKGKKSKVEPFTLNKVESLMGLASTKVENAHVDINIDVEDLLNFTKGVKAGAKHDTDGPVDALINIQIENGKGLVLQHNGADFRATHIEDKYANRKTAECATLDAELLEPVLNLFNALGYDDARMLIGGAFRPVEFRSWDDAIRMVVLPVRKY